MGPRYLACFAPRREDTRDAVAHFLATDGRVVLTPTALGGRAAIRAAFSNATTTEDDLELVCGALAEAAREQSPEPLRRASQFGQRWRQEARAVLGERTLVFGASPPAEVSRSGYQRVNLRGMGAEELLGMGLPGLYALVPLTRDGASEAGVQRAGEAIGREERVSAARRADYLAVLRFIAEAEGVPVAVLRACIAKEELMESELYQSILAEGRAEGRAEGEAWGRTEGRARAEAQLRVDAIVRLLEARLGALEAGVRERLSAVTDLKVLEGWYEAAFAMGDKRAARRLMEAIRRETER